MVGIDDEEREHVPTSLLHGKQSDMDDLTFTLEKLKDKVNDDSEGAEVIMLTDILTNPMMQSLIQMHESMTSPSESIQNFHPISNNAGLLIRELNKEVEQNLDDISSEFAELSLILRSSHVISLLESHDQIANKDFEPHLPEISENQADFSGDESIKVVRLVKGNEPLGATIALDEITSNIIIARIMRGGAADRSGLIHVNDILVEVNNISVQGKQPSEIIKLLSTFRGPLTFRLIPGEKQNLEDVQTATYIKAHVDYNPIKDILIPCPEAGLPFFKNDILEIVSKDDATWWQAVIVKSTNPANTSNGNSDRGRAGLIPSAELHSKRVHLRRQASLRTVSVKGSTTSLSSNRRHGSRSPWSRLRSSFRKSNRYAPVDKREQTRSKEDVRVVMHPIIPNFHVYEEVTQLLPGNHVEGKIYRPIVLVGPHGIGRNELKDRLIHTNPTYYGVPIPHTSRDRQDDEEDGKDYYFVSRAEMESSIKENKFLEYGEYKGNLYGTSLEAVQDVVKSSQVCILTPYPQALKYLRIPELKPFIIFIKPPSFHDLYQDSKKSGSSKQKLTIDRDMNAPFKLETLKDLSQRAEEIERTYSHLFDCTITFKNVDAAFAQLKQIVFDVEHQPQWLPKKWFI